MQPIFFTKFMFLNQSYLIINHIEDAPTSLDYATLATAITDEETGIFAHYAIILTPSEQADFKITTYNHKGVIQSITGSELLVIRNYLEAIERLTNPTTIEANQNNYNLVSKDTDIYVDLGFAYPMIDLYPLTLNSQVNEYCKEIKTPYGTWEVDEITLESTHFIIYTDDDHIGFKESLAQISNHHHVNIALLTTITPTECLLSTYDQTLGWNKGSSLIVAAATASATARHLLTPYEKITMYLGEDEWHAIWNEESHLLISAPPSTKMSCGTYFFQSDKKDA